MRLRISHQITCAYDTPAPSVVQILRLTPRNYDAQVVRRWQIESNADASLKAREDAFGNISHILTLAGPIAGVTFAIQGEVDTHDANGVVAGAHERFPTRLYLRETEMTRPEAGLAAFALDAAGTGGALEQLHALMKKVHEFIDVEPSAGQGVVTAAEALVLRHGSAEDAAQVFIAACRCRGIPARFVSGYVVGDDGRGSGHGWAEAHVERLGWVGFDPAHCICVTDAYVRVSIGLDYHGAAPLRSVHAGTCAEKRSVAVNVSQAQGQRQA